jgi:hypothetical protein
MGKALFQELFNTFRFHLMSLIAIVCKTNFPGGLPGLNKCF